jgi:hypothetical protein
MVLIWRKKNTWDIKVKIAVTALFWILLFTIGQFNDRNSNTRSYNDRSNVSVTDNRTPDTTSSGDQSGVVDNRNTTTDNKTSNNDAPAVTVS